MNNTVVNASKECVHAYTETDAEFTRGLAGHGRRPTRLSKLVESMRISNVTVTVKTREPWSYVRVRDKNTGIEGVGFSRCNPGDEWKPSTGIALAKARAFREFYARTANELIEQTRMQ